jgi:Flp pilus assembly protein TadG
VEFVAMTPVILVALMFSFEFGKALWAYDVMTRDVRSAARFLSRDGTTNFTAAVNVAETGSPAGGTKHFPWNVPDCDGGACIQTTPVAKTGTYSETVTVYEMVASVPISLGFLEAMNNFLSAANIPTSYTLVVSDEARWIGE